MKVSLILVLLVFGMRFGEMRNLSIRLLVVMFGVSMICENSCSVWWKKRKESISLYCETLEVKSCSIFVSGLFGRVELKRSIWGFIVPFQSPPRIMNKLGSDISWAFMHSLMKLEVLFCSFVLAV